MSGHRTPTEELHFRVEQLRNTNANWELVSIDETKLEAVLVLRNRIWRRASVVPSEENPKLPDQWRRLWIDERGRWHSQQVDGPGMPRPRGRRGPQGSYERHRRSDEPASDAERAWRRIGQVNRNRGSA